VSSASIVVNRLRLLQAAAGRQPWWESAPSLSRSFGCIKRSYSGSGHNAEPGLPGKTRVGFGQTFRGA
jgi:hypothetical protein